MSKALQRVQRSTFPPHSKTFRTYLHEDVFVFPNGVDKFSRSDISRLTESPCIRAAFALFRAFEKYNINSPARLNTVGCKSLLRCKGVGERASWIAAIILGECGYDVTEWFDKRDGPVRNVRDRIRLVHSKTKKQKHG